MADGRKGDKLPVNTTNCGQREWPYIAHTCLVSTSGSPVRKISRVVTIERQVTQNLVTQNLVAQNSVAQISSDLLSPATAIASR